MAENGSFEASGFGASLRARGRETISVVSAAVIVILLVVMFLLSQRTMAEGLRTAREDHTRLTDAVEALVWTNMPPDIRAKLPMPKWVREQIHESSPR